MIKRWHFALLIITAAFVAWAAAFILNSSFRAINGERYFCLFDDAMISMRYAWNLSHGHGLVWNDGVRVEGITNTLMTLYMAVGTLLFDKRIAVLFMQLSGIGFLLSVALLTMGIARQAFGRRGFADRPIYSILGFVAGLAYYPLLYWSLMGMETGLLTVLLLGGVLLVLRSDKQMQPQWLLAIVLGLAFWTRPDALIPIGLIMAYRWLPIFNQADGRRAMLIEGLIIAAFIAGITAFRFLYYGSPLPNTYLLKATGMPLGNSLNNGIGFITPFLLNIALPGLLALIFVIIRPRRHSIFFLVLLALSIVYQIWVGGDPWAYWRIMSPFVPLLLVICLEALRSLTFRLPGSALLVAAGSLVIVYLINPLPFRAEALLLEKPYQVKNNQDNVNTALLLMEIARPGANVAVLWAGAIPYYSGLNAIDLLGKSDRHIAQLPPDLSGGIAWLGMNSVPGHNKYDLVYSILQLRPTYTQTLAWGRQDISAQASMYQRFEYGGYPLLLDTDSSLIDWTRVHDRP